MEQGNRSVNTVSKEMHLYSVGEVCSLTGVTRKKLFYYDKNGLLKPTDRITAQKFKLYDADQLARLNKILIYRSAGLSIKEIKAILDDGKATHLAVLESALKRLEMEKDDKEAEIERLKNLIEKEKNSN